MNLMPEAGAPGAGKPPSTNESRTKQTAPHPARPVEVRANGAKPPTRLADPLLRSKFGFGDDDAWLATARRAEATVTPGRIGPYEIVGQIGRGGQGAVYKAIQPGTGREIAIKRLGAGVFADEPARARFRREVETSAALSHPGVVTVFGCDFVDGQQLLLMEFVSGVPIDRWASPESGPRRSWQEIFTLFVQVCQAVSHAHQRGVIHRDLKPSNILVDDQGRARVLDFGLAKVLGPQWQGAMAGESRAVGASATRSSMDSFVGTPMFAAPEQVDGRLGSTDTRTDVYGLAAVLYQLICGHTPFDPGSSLAALFDSIRTGVRATPSACYPALPRELDCIVMKAMALEPAMRYQSVDAMAEDLRRALAGHAVLAHPPSAFYTARSFVRRHPTGVALAGTALAAVLTLSIVSSILAWRLDTRQIELRASLKDAEDQAHRHAAAAGFLTNLLESLNEAASRGDDVTAAMMVRGAAAKLDSGELANQPAVEAEILYSVARAFVDFDDYRSAGPYVERAVAANLALYGPKDVRTAQSVYLAGLLAERNGDLQGSLARYEASAAVLRELGETRMRLYGLLLNNMGVVLRDLDRLEESVAALQKALALRREMFGAVSAEAAGTLRNLGYAIHEQKRYDEGRAMIVESVEIAAKVFGERHERTRLFKTYVARADVKAGRVAEAVELLESLRAESIADTGPDSPATLGIQLRLGEALVQAKNLERAIEMFDRFVRYGARTTDSQSSRQPLLRSRLAGLLIDVDRRQEAAAQLDVAERECPAGDAGARARESIAKARARLENPTK